MPEEWMGSSISLAPVRHWRDLEVRGTLRCSPRVRRVRVSSEFKINKQGIAQIQRELEREFAKRPIRVPLAGDPSSLTAPHSTVINYLGPVVTVTGDHAQLAWGNDAVHQGQSTATIADGYAELAAVVTKLLALVDQLGLPAEDVADAEDQARTVLAEVTRPSPDSGVVRRGVTMLKGVLAAVAAGVYGGVTAETSEAARDLIEKLVSALAG